MLNYLLRRTLVALLVAFTVSVVGFSLLRLSGNLAEMLAGPQATPEEVAKIAQVNGLDRPLPMQYADWLGRLLHGDLGRSIFTDERVADLIATHVGITVELALLALPLALLIAVPLGVLAAWRSNTWIDRAAAVVAVTGQGLPTFLLALLLIECFGVWLRVLPVSGSDTPAHLVLPVLALAISTVPAFMRLTRSGMVDALGSEYVRTARAKGLPARTVVFKHALRNAILPIVSLSAVQLGFVLGGSVVVESVFGLDGIGMLAYQSILRNDFPVVQSILVAIACAYVVLTLLADLLNARIDPRIELK